MYETMAAAGLAKRKDGREQRPSSFCAGNGSREAYGVGADLVPKTRAETGSAKNDGPEASLVWKRNAEEGGGRR